MGRKGMKGFLKGVHKHDGPDDEAPDAAAEQAQASTSKPAAAADPAEKFLQKPAAPAKADEPDSARAGDDDSEDGDSGDKGPETRGRMLQRHKREMVAHKKAVQKLGSKKKDEAAKLTAEIEARHARELRELEEREKAAAAAPAPVSATATEGAAGAGPAAADGPVGQMAGLAIGASEAADQHKKPTKAQKRREKLAQQEAEREQRIASEQASLGPSDKAVEEEQLLELLLPLKLGIREIRADGHCMYRAVEDQLTQQAAASSSSGENSGDAAAVPDYQALRRLTASYIRSHPDDFLPFIYDEDGAGGPEEQLEAYCGELEGTAVWGGQLELGALAQALKRQIKVHATGMPTVTLGDEHQAAGVLQLCYLRHAFGLGEHYNSVVPLGRAQAAEEEE